MVLTRRAWCPGRSLLLRRHTVALLPWIGRLGLHLGVLQFGQAGATVTPVAASSERWRGGAGMRVLSLGAPLHTRRATKGAWRLVCLRVDILWQGSASLVWQTVRRLPLKQREPSLDVDIVRVEISCPSIGIQRVAGLVVARLVLQSMC